MRTGPAIIPARHDARFARVFAWYNRRLINRHFHALRIEAASLDACRGLNHEPRPLVLCLNHASWWDPLITLALAERVLPDRCGIAPIDSAQMERFGFFRKLGLFGIDPNDPGALDAMLNYTLEWLRSHERPTLALTPQGRFADVRETIVIRPGAAAAAARLGPGGCVVASLAIEYAFWQDQRPEVFARLTPIKAPDDCTTAGWHRVILETMRENAAELSRMVIARDPRPFTTPLGRSSPRVHPVYDLWLRLRGRAGAIPAGHSRRGDAPGGNVSAVETNAPLRSEGAAP